MTIDYRQLYPKIQQLADRIEQASTLRHRRCQEALQALARFASTGEFLNNRIERALAQEGKNLRCAKPYELNLNATFPLPTQRRKITLTAADGSQILPDRHDALFFGLINVGGIVLPQSNTDPPCEISRSEFWYSEAGDFNEAQFNFRRDVLERRFLLEISLSLGSPTLALMDGPLELWMEYRAADEERPELMNLLHSYLETLDTFREQAILLGGYVDRPESAYVVRLLELAIATEHDLSNLRRFHPFKGVTDIDLFNLLLRPGERSAIFRLQSPLLEHLPQESELCFFYLCVGNETHPSIARVEIPLWLASDLRLVSDLHYNLVAQCRLSGAYAYPYLLHRAHEIAVVHAEDREAIIRSLQIELQRRGHRPQQLSNKQALKNLNPRKKLRLE